MIIIIIIIIIIITKRQGKIEQKISCRGKGYCVLCFSCTETENEGRWNEDMTRDQRDVSSPNRINCFRTNQRLFYELTLEENEVKQS